VFISVVAQSRLYTGLTPFFARANVRSEMGPYAGRESHNERWITVRVFADGAAEAEGNGSGLDVPYMSETHS